MKLSKQTIQVLKWCSLVQDDIYIEPGRVLDTISRSKGTRLHAVIPDEFPMPWGIQDFGSVARHLDEDTEINLDDPAVVRLSSGRNTVTFKQVPKNLILRPTGGVPTPKF